MNLCPGGALLFGGQDGRLPALANSCGRQPASCLCNLD